MRTLTLTVLDEALQICRFGPGSKVPIDFGDSPFWSVTRTRNEISVVLPEDIVTESENVDAGWRALMVEGQLDFGLTGILAGLAVPLAKVAISIFAISTFDTDYILVKQESLEPACDVLIREGHTITGYKEK